MISAIGSDTPFNVWIKQLCPKMAESDMITGDRKAKLTEASTGNILPMDLVYFCSSSFNVIPAIRIIKLMAR